MEHQKHTKLYSEEKHHWWFQSRRDIISHLFWKRNFHFPKNPSILSVGTSSGAELEYLSQFGQTKGIDICDNLVNFNKRNGLDVDKMDITKCTFADNAFDIVFAMDVLEHIEDDRQAFAQIIRVLKPGGYAVVTVPAHMFLWSQHDVETGHVRRYNKSNFKQLLQSQKISILRLQYYNFFLMPLVAATRKSKISPDTQKALPLKLVNTLLRHVFSSERFFMKWIGFPTGVSLFAIIKKENQ